VAVERAKRPERATLSDMGQKIAQHLQSIGVPATHWVTWIADQVGVSKYAAHKWLYSPRQQISEENAKKLGKALTRASERPFSLVNLRTSGSASRGLIVADSGGQGTMTVSPREMRTFEKLFAKLDDKGRSDTLDFMLDRLVAAPSVASESSVVLQMRKKLDEEEGNLASR